MARITSLSSVLVASLITSTAVLVSGNTIHLTLPTNPLQTLSETVTRTFTNDLPPLSNDIPSQTTVSICPTVVSLTEVCSECVTIACVAPLTITAPCGCPDPAVTKYDSHPCGMGCAGLEGCQTKTTVVTPTDCPSSGSGSGSGSRGPSSTGSGSGSSSSDMPTTTTETGVSSSEPSPTSTETTVIVTTPSTDNPSTSVSTSPTSSSSTAAAARLAPFRFW